MIYILLEKTFRMAFSNSNIFDKISFLSLAQRLPRSIMSGRATPKFLKASWFFMGDQSDDLISAHIL